MQNEYYPPASFYFDVKVAGSPSPDFRFQEVKGLEMTASTEPIEEGGLNNYIHQVPKRPAFTKLTLSRGLMINSYIRGWVENALLNFQFEPKTVTICLYGANHNAISIWSVVNAYPIKWSVSNFHATENKLAIETMELQYSYFKRL
jgi:phage tail-like protein